MRQPRQLVFNSAASASFIRQLPARITQLSILAFSVFFLLNLAFSTPVPAAPKNVDDRPVQVVLLTSGLNTPQTDVLNVFNGNAKFADAVLANSDLPPDFIYANPLRTSLALLAAGELNHPANYADSLQSLLSGAKPNQANEFMKAPLLTQVKNAKLFPSFSAAKAELPKRLRDQQTLTFIQLPPAGSPEFTSDLQQYHELFLNSPHPAALVSLAEVNPDFPAVEKAPVASLQYIITNALPNPDASTDAWREYLQNDQGSRIYAPTLRSFNTRSTGILTIPDVSLFLASGRNLSSSVFTAQSAPVVIPDSNKNFLGFEITAQAFGLGSEVVSSDLLLQLSGISALIHRVTLPLLLAWLLPWLGIGTACAVVAYFTHARSARTVANLRRAAALCFTIAPLILPASYFLNSYPLLWWLSDSPLPAAIALASFTATIFALPVAILFLLSQKRTGSALPAIALAATLVAGVPLLDAALGSQWQLLTPLGADPLWGGRFYGISNHVYALILAGVIWPVWLISRRLSRRFALVFIALTYLVVAGICIFPTMGADVGSLLANTVLFGLLFAEVGRIKLSWRRVLAVLVSASALLTAIGLWDYARPPAQRSHLGRFMAQVISGEASATIWRKLSQNLTMVIDFPALIPAVLVTLILLVVVFYPPVTARVPGLNTPTRVSPASFTVTSPHVGAQPRLLVFIRALAWAALTGFALNDTGTVLLVVAAGVTVAFTAAYLLGQSFSAERAAYTQ